MNFMQAKPNLMPQAIQRLKGDSVFRSQIEKEVGGGMGGDWAGALESLRSQERGGELIRGKAKLAGLREEEGLEDIQNLISQKTSPVYQGLRKARSEREMGLKQQQLESGLSDEEFEDVQNEYRMAGGSATGMGLKDFINRRKGIISQKFQFSPIGSGIPSGIQGQTGGIIGGSMNRMFA